MQPQRILSRARAPPRPATAAAISSSASTGFSLQALNVVSLSLKFLRSPQDASLVSSVISRQLGRGADLMSSSCYGHVAWSSPPGGMSWGEGVLEQEAWSNPREKAKLSKSPVTVGKGPRGGHLPLLRELLFEPSLSRARCISVTTSSTVPASKLSLPQIL